VQEKPKPSKNMTLPNSQRIGANTPATSENPAERVPTNTAKRDQANMAERALENMVVRDPGEHGGERSGEHGEEGEESGTEYSLNQTYNNVRNGARLILSYDTQTNSFIGTVENTTDRILQRVRVEVHLSNGIELGPTTPVDLIPGEKRAFKLTASGRDFEKWSAHPEVGGSEHGG